MREFGRLWCGSWCRAAYTLSPPDFGVIFHKTVDANVEWLQYRSHTTRNYDNLCLVLILKMFEEFRVSVIPQSVKNKHTVVF